MLPPKCVGCQRTERTYWDIKKDRNPCLSSIYGLRRSSWFYVLVEVAGIEPASANPLPSDLHAYPDLLI